MKCKRCGYDNPENSMFCTRCGAPLLQDVREEKQNPEEWEGRSHKKRRGWLWVLLLLLVVCLLAAAVIWIWVKRMESSPSENVWESGRTFEARDEDIDETKNTEEERAGTKDMGSAFLMEEETAQGFHDGQDGNAAEEYDEMEPAPKTEQSPETAEAFETTGMPETDTESGTETEARAYVRSGPLPLEASVEASSTLTGGDYDVGNLLDEDLTTAWHEGAEGMGEGESVTFYFAEEELIYGLAFIPGYLKSSKLFIENGRPTKLRIDVGEMYMAVMIEEYEPDFESVSASMLYAEFPEPVYAKELMVTIVSAIWGEKYEDTGITEMYPYTYKWAE